MPDHVYKSEFLRDMHWRGQISQITSPQEFDAHLCTPDKAARKAYAGFDPTADSLTIGNLVTIMALVRFAKAGHSPIVVVGGGTGLIGDPSGKSAERQLLTPERVDQNVQGQRRIFDAIWHNAGLGTPPIRNNYEWLKNLSYLDALRDVGKYFSVNMMIQKDSVKDRLHNRDQGISYTEFSYMILQAYDYMRLFQHDGVTVQMGGSDQFGNIICGLDLIRRQRDLWAQSLDALLEAIRSSVNSGSCAPELKNEWLVFEAEHNDAMGAYKRLQLHQSRQMPEADWVNQVNAQEERMRSAKVKIVNAALTYGDSKIQHLAQEISPLLNKIWVDAFGLTWPLITKADGGKFGKTESGAVWLTPDRTSPFAFYQFWLNSADADIPKFLRTFTLLPHAEIEQLEAAHASDPAKRDAHRALARHMTTLLHGAAATDDAEAAAKALFSGEVAGLPEATLREVFSQVPTSQHDKSTLASGVPILDLLVTTKLAASKREAKEFLAGGSVLINGTRKATADGTLTPADLLHGSMILIRRGKKNWHLTSWK